MRSLFFLGLSLLSINCFAFPGSKVAAIFADERFASMSFSSIESIKELSSFLEDGYDHTYFMVKADGTTCIPVTVTNTGTKASPIFIVSSSSIITSCTAY